MIVGKFINKPVLRNTDDASAGGGLNIIEDDGDGDGTGGLVDDQPGSDKSGGDGTHADAENEGDEDRGDNLDGNPDADTLRDIAGTTGATGATDGDAAAAEGEGAGNAGNRVPQGRLNEVIAERNAARERAEALERENAALKAAQQPGAPASTPPAATPAAPTPPAFDTKAKERQYAELLAEGEFDQAADLRMEINAHIQKEATEQARSQMAAEALQATVGEVASQAVKDFPFLDTDEGAPAMAAIMAERNRLYATGIPLADALDQAVTKLAPRLAPEGFVVPESRKGAAHPPGKGSTTAAPTVDTRTAAARARGAAVSGQQPPALKGGEGNGRNVTGVVDPDDMSEEQFDALSPEEKRRMRGD